jgi:hypothetical protein
MKYQTFWRKAVENDNGLAKIVNLRLVSITGRSVPVRGRCHVAPSSICWQNRESLGHPIVPLLGAFRIFLWVYDSEPLAFKVC